MNKQQKLPVSEQIRNNRVAQLLSNRNKTTQPVQVENKKVSTRNDDKDALAQYADNLREQRKQHWQQLSQRFI